MSEMMNTIDDINSWYCQKKVVNEYIYIYMEMGITQRENTREKGLENKWTECKGGMW